MTTYPIGLFGAFGVELEYMIVDAQTLDVLPVADELLRSVAGSYAGEVELGAISWSNELVTHVVELKTTDPAATLAGLDALFADHVRRINERLEPLGARLLPTGMHPWMNPLRETKLWPHEYSAVYEQYNRVFGCQGHGWSNLQSAHLNLPFANDEEFGRLHAAIRLLLPILPALAASSPIVDGRVSRQLDARLDVYRTNSLRVPSVTGRVIPEGVFSRAAYESEILGRIYAEIAPLDPAGTLQHEWLNARGAIARFDRGTIEIRVLDTQECPAADLAICRIAVEVLAALAAERWTSLADQQACRLEPLADIFLATVAHGERAAISDANYLRQFGYAGNSCTAGELWRRLLAELTTPESDRAWQRPLEVILERGPLARRILTRLRTPAAQSSPPREALTEIYRELADCLARGEMFGA